MATVQTIRGLLQTRLLTVGTGWTNQTAYEGLNFQPTDSTPYQELTTVFATPNDFTLSDSSQFTGTFQVRLLYPLTKSDGTGTAQAGIGAPTARAQAIADAFPRNLVLTSGGNSVKVIGEPHITRGPPQGDRDVTIVRVRFSNL